MPRVDTVSGSGTAAEYLCPEPWRLDVTAVDFLDLARERVDTWNMWREDVAARTPSPDGQMIADHMKAGERAQLIHRSWRPLALASSHMGAAFELRGDHGAVWVATHQVMCRTALIGAAKVIYLLRPEAQAERITRALLLAQHEQSSIGRAIKESIRLTEEAPTDTRHDLDTMRDELIKQEGFHEEVSKELTMILMGRHAEKQQAKGGIGDGAVVKDAVSVLSHDYSALATSASSWHLGSMAAHVSMLWFDYQSEQEANIDPAEQLASMLLPPVLLTDAAWKLWEHRRSQPKNA